MSEYLDKTGLSYFWGKVKEKIADSVKSVNYATSAGSATRATQDSSGQQINTTYIKDVSISGKGLKNYALNYTRGDGNHVSEMLGMVDDIYPIGSIYISTNPITPENFIVGTTWVLLNNAFEFNTDHKCYVWERTK